MSVRKHNLVFIVEDNEMYSMMLDYKLSGEVPAHFNSFRTGEECIRHLDLRPALVILDYDLPGMDGLETLGRIKTLNSDVPVVVFSSETRPGFVKRFLDAGAYDFLVKEKDTVRQLSEIIHKVLNEPAAKKARAYVVPRGVLIGLMVMALLILGLLYFSRPHCMR